MSSPFERSASAAIRRREGGPRRGRRAAGLCAAVGITLAALATAAPMLGLAGEGEEPGAAGRAPAAAAASLFVVPMLEVEPSQQTKLFWFVAGGEDAPAGTHVQVKGLATGVTLSNGETNAEGNWVVPLSEIEDLQIMVAPTFSGKLTLDVALVDRNGAVLDEHPAELRLKPTVAAAGTGPAGADIATGAVPRQTQPEPAAAPPVDVTSTTAEAAPAETAEAAPADAPSRPVVAPPRQEATLSPTPAPRPPEPAVAPVPGPREPASLPQATTEPATLAQANRLLQLGDRSFAQGNIAEARQYFARAVDLGLAIAALRMAETYDPNELARPAVFGVKPNPAEARRWYQRAVELGVPGALTGAQRLGTR